MIVEPHNPTGGQGCALVTGASRGIGAAIAANLADAGWPVAVNYRADAASAHRVVAEIEQAGGRAFAVRADISRPEEVARLFESVEDSCGPVLVLVNNAGKRDDQIFSAMEPQAWQGLLETNLTSAFHTTQAALASMAGTRFGRIVNIGSVTGQLSIPGAAGYATAKAGLEGLTRSVAIEVARRGITVNLVAPGLVRTELVDGLMIDRDRVRAVVPARRAAEPCEIAACVRFLVSAEAS
jgi:3-oxoacyl-[acyl-carrier protein] reductase